MPSLPIDEGIFLLCLHAILSNDWISPRMYP